MKPVSEVLVFDVYVFAVECSKKALLWTVVVARNENVSKYFTIYIGIAVKPVKCVNEDVLALVGVFVASRSCNN